MSPPNLQMDILPFPFSGQTQSHADDSVAAENIIIRPTYTSHKKKPITPTTTFDNYIQSEHDHSLEDITLDKDQHTNNQYQSNLYCNELDNLEEQEEFDYVKMSEIQNMKNRPSIDPGQSENENYEYAAYRYTHEQQMENMKEKSNPGCLPNPNCHPINIKKVIKTRIKSKNNTDFLNNYPNVVKTFPALRAISKYFDNTYV